MKNFVDSTWLMNHLKENNLFIIDCRFDLFDPSYGKKTYASSHIDGAFYLDINIDFAGDKKIHGGARPLPDLTKISKKLEYIGINAKSTIVLYDDRTYSSARAWWQLKYLGLKNIYILDGGYEQWIELNLPTSNDIPTPKQNGNLNPNLINQMYCDINYVKKTINNSESILLDSREQRRYTGEYEPLYSKNGHIPGAINFHWNKNVDQHGKVKTKTELIDNFKFIDNEKEIITYCGSGIDAAMNFVILDELGYKPKLYVGSVSDWVSYEENKLETSN
jgi:thiosulfate/3-mercaptopyruvate sulfurtransferase